MYSPARPEARPPWRPAWGPARAVRRPRSAVWHPFGGAWAPVGAAARREAADLDRFVAALHRIDPPRGPPAGPATRIRGLLLALKDRDVRAPIDALHATFDGGTPSAAWDAALRTPEWPGPAVWFPEDIHAVNLLVAGGRIRPARRGRPRLGPDAGVDAALGRHAWPDPCGAGGRTTRPGRAAAAWVWPGASSRSPTVGTATPCLRPSCGAGATTPSRTPGTAGEVSSLSRGRAFVALPVPAAPDTTVLAPVQEVPPLVTAKRRGAAAMCPAGALHHSPRRKSETSGPAACPHACG